MPTLPFSVDAALLKELGDRLVGKPHIALAELVKNGYDADATEVTIKVYPDKDLIEIRDNGNGMDFEEFKNFWMRIGSPHKEKQKISRHFERPMTGSKGVGRLSVQFLAKNLEIQTISENSIRKLLIATVEWEKAIQSTSLTTAKVEYRIEEKNKHEEPFKKGTIITLTGLKHNWKDDEFVLGLAKEIWWLQPPFRKLKTGKKDPTTSEENTFIIDFESSDKKLTKEFNRQVTAVLNLWHAKITGKCTEGKLNFSLEFEKKIPKYYEYEIPDCKFKEADFEIRIFSLEKKRQPHGISVLEAREYLDRYGGVHVYDSGFHLPYYGLKINDWLEIEHDHAMRTRQTKLLPKELQFDGGILSFLPNLQRIFGVVNVDTSKEDKDGLKILITRDRLQDGKALDDLKDVIRYTMDLYANEEARRSYEEGLTTREIESPKEKFEKIEDVLVKHRDEIPEKVYTEIQAGVKEVTNSLHSDAEATVKRMSLLGPLATAGISSLAYQHELKRQFRVIDDIVSRIDTIVVEDQESRNTLSTVKEDLSSWVNSAKATNALFTYLSDSENLYTNKRFKAKIVIENVSDQVKVLGRGIQIETNRIDEKLLLPKATFPEWSSIFQNVFLNAFNALLDSKKKEIDVSSRSREGYFEILVQDTGSGVDLKDAENLFKPFERRMTITPQRQSLGYGGTGLGLTIVHLVATNIGCSVSFVKPELGYKTAFSIKWRELK
jgi:signal transduction histidine kinase